MATLTSTDGSDLKRGSLGAWDIVFFVVAAAAPLTVMVGVAPIALLIGGIGAPAGYLVAGLISTVFALGFTKMAPYIHNNGAFYSYIQAGLGKAAGLGSAITAVVSYNLLQFSVYGLFGAITAGTANDLLGIDLPWWAWSLMAVAVVGVLGYRSVHLGARVLGILLVLEVLILVLLAVFVLAEGGATGLTLSPFAPSNVFTGSMGAVLAVAFAAFVGFEGTALYRDEVKEPDRSIPKATYIAVGFLSLFYCFIVWIIIMAFGPADVVGVAAQDPAALFFIAMDTYVGGWATTLMQILITTSGLAALLAFHNAIARYGFALGTDGVFPRGLAAVHPKHRSPYIAGLWQTVIATVAVVGFAISGVDPIVEMAAWTASSGTVAIIALQALTALSVARFFSREVTEEGAGTTVMLGWIGFGLLSIAVALIVRHIDIATLSENVSVNGVVLALPLASFALGAGLAAWLRTNRPEVYSQLGTANVDADAVA